jgi:predicted RecA/RadA family phage recombinase
MTDFNIATGEEQPLNRTGFDNVQITGEQQGVPVGVDTSGTEPKLVAADAGASANEAGTGPINAVGVLFPREILPDDLSNVNQHPWDDIEKQIYMEDRTLAGDRATVIRNGIEMVNDDDDTSFEPGEPVYLAPGGGFTQTKPSGSGEAVQVLGVACTTMDDGVNPNNVSKDRIFLEVEADYEVLA